MAEEAFCELAARVQRLWDGGMDVGTIVTTLEGEGVAPVLGASRWDKWTVDRLLTVAGTLRAAMAAAPPPAPRKDS